MLHAAIFVPGHPSMADRLAPSTRHKFVHEGRTIYEWDQTISEVNIYVDVPPSSCFAPSRHTM